MKKLILCFLSLSTTIALYSQKDSTSISKAINKVTDKFPITRFVDIEYQQISASDFKSKLFKEDYKDGETKDRRNLRMAVNLPVIRKQNWAITTSFLYNYSTLNLENVTYKQEQVASDIFPNNPELHYLAATTSFSYSSKLFGKRALYNLSLKIDGSQKRVEALRAMATGVLVLKATPQTIITTGLAVSYDATSLLPVLPVFTLEQKFGNGYTLDAVLPQRIVVKKAINKNGRLSLGSELRSNTFYLYPDKKEYARSYYYRELQIRSGFTYEHRINSFIVYGKAGLTNVINAKVTETGKRTKDHIYSAKYDPSLYFNIGVSFNPQKVF